MTAVEFLKLWTDQDGEPDDWEIVEPGDWIQDGKYQVSATVYAKDGQFFMICETRSGSYHSDWYYNDPECYEVEQHTETKVVTTYNFKK